MEIKDMKLVELARQRVADRYVQTYMKNAILGGEWDRGDLVKAEYAAIADAAPQTVEEEGNDE